MIGRTALHLEYLAHGGRIGGVRADPVNGLGRKYHQIAGAQGFDGFFDLCLCCSYHTGIISRLRHQRSSLAPAGTPICAPIPLFLRMPLLTLLDAGVNCRRKHTFHEPLPATVGAHVDTVLHAVPLTWVTCA